MTQRMKVDEIDVTLPEDIRVLAEASLGVQSAVRYSSHTRDDGATDFFEVRWESRAASLGLS
jgi:hypothetical protein